MSDGTALDPPAPAPSPVTAATPRRALGDVLVQIVARVGNLGLGVVVTALLARTLGDAGYGQWSTLLSTLQLLAFLATLGLEQVAVRQAASDPERSATWTGALILTRLALAVPSMLVAALVVLYVQESTTMLVAGLVLVLQFPLSVASSLAIVHQLRVRNAVPMIVLTLNSVLWTGYVLVVYLSDGGLLALAIGMVAVGVISTSTQAVASLRLLGAPLRSSRAAVMELLRIGAPLGLAGLLVNAYGRIDQIIVYKQAGSVDAGLYGAAYRLLDQAQFVPVSVLTTIAPLTAALWITDRGRMLRLVGLAMRLLTVASLGALAFTLVGSRPLMRAIFGADFSDAGQALPILCGAFVFICFGYIVANLLLVLDLVRKQVIVGLIGLVVNVVGNLILVPRYGFVGAAWMTLVTEAAVIACAAFFVLRGLQLERLDPRPLLRVVAAAALLTGLLALCRSAGGGLVVLLAVAGLAYPALLLALRAIGVAELRELLSRPAA